MEPYELGAFHVGDCIPPLAIHRDGCVINFIGGVLHINTLVYRPQSTLQDKADIGKYGMRLGIFTCQNAMILALKLGNLPWQDAPFTPHLTQEEDLPENNPLPNGDGLVAYHLLIDSAEGRILQINPFVLSSHFSNSLIDAIYTLKKDPFDQDKYVSTLNDIQRRYSSQDLGTRFSSDYFRLPPRDK